MGQKAGLSADDVIDAATEVADRDGLDNLTLAQVADHLGIRPPSLYNHVAGLEGLHRELALRATRCMNDTFADACDGRDGDDSFRAMATAYRSFGRTHPGLFRALLRIQNVATDERVWAAAQDTMDPVIVVMEEIGFTGEDVLVARRITRAALTGFVSLEMDEGFVLPLDMDSAYADLVEVLLTGLRALARRR